MKKILFIALLGALIAGCVSAQDVTMHATAKTEQGAISIISVTREDSYWVDNTIHSAKDPSKDSLVVVKVSFVNLGNQEVVISPYSAQLEPVSGTYGVIPVAVDFINFGDGALAGFTGNLAITDIKLAPGKAARRVFVFVYPKDKVPTSFHLSKGSDPKNSEIWLTSPIKL